MVKKLQYIFVFFMILFMYILALSKINAETFNVYEVKTKCSVRDKAGDNNAPLTSGGDIIYVFANQPVDFLSSTKAIYNGDKNAIWYAIKFDYAAKEYTGYVPKSCLYDVKTYSYNDSEKFEANIKNFPDSYKPYLRKLHAMHPNWTFVVDKNNLDWVKTTTQESIPGQSAISNIYTSLIYKDETYPNGILVDGTTWFAPCLEAVAYYLDPRNFLNEKYIFMFETLSYSNVQDSSVPIILKGSFMEGTFKDGEKNKKYSDAFIEAARLTNVSSSHLASRSLQEMGTKMSSAASGTVQGYEGYYNFYNIGAYSGTDNYLKGLQYAKDHGWDSVQKSITGGAEFIGSSYINKGQDTIYYEKFNVSSKTKNPYTHQYMTNVVAPSSEASKIYTSYKSNNMLSNSYSFTIPVFNNMPSTAVKVLKIDTIGGQEKEPEQEEQAEEKIEEVIVKPEEKIANAGYKLTNGFITKITYKTDMSSLRNLLVKQNASIGTTNSSFKAKTSGIIATGDKVEVDGKTYETVIYGDASGDGEITIKDLLQIQKHLLGAKTLSGSYKEASDVSKDKEVTIKDLLQIQKYLLGYKEITQ